MNNCFPQNITILLEPTAECNLRCRHCYHAKTDYTSNKMTYATLEKLLQCLSIYYKDVKIIWHGGEPLLMGYDFFKKAYVLFDKYSSQHEICFKFGVQTNGTLLDKHLIDIFEKTNTHISLSYDGEYNGVLRQKTEVVERVINELKSRGVAFSCISTISSANVCHMIAMYEYFKKLDVSVKFNPIYPDGAAINSQEYLIKKEEWTSNFINLFKHWFFDTNCNISFVSCEDILKKYLFEFNGCMGGACLYLYLAVDSYGDIYPCGRLIRNDCKLTNVNEINDIRDVFICKRYSELLDSNIKRGEKCKDCKWISRCHSGCNASAILGENIERPYSFDCYFTNGIFQTIESLIREYNSDKINHYAAEILNQRHS